MSVARHSKSSASASGRHSTNAPWSSPRRDATGAATGVCGLGSDAAAAGDDATHGSGVSGTATESSAPFASLLRAGDDRSPGATLMAAIEDASMLTSPASLADAVAADDAAPSITVSPSLAARPLGDAVSPPAGAMAPARRSCPEEGAR